MAIYKTAFTQKNDAGIRKVLSEQDELVRQSIENNSGIEKLQALLIAGIARECKTTIVTTTMKVVSAKPSVEVVTSYPKAYKAKGFQDLVGFKNFNLGIHMALYQNGGLGEFKRTPIIVTNDFQVEAIGHKLFVMGGRIKDIRMNDVYVYDKHSTVWKKTGGMKHPRNKFATAVLDGKIYAFSKSTMECYDPSTGVWSNVEIEYKNENVRHNMHERYNDTGVAIDGKFYICGGYNATIMSFTPGEKELRLMADGPTLQGGGHGRRRWVFVHDWRQKGYTLYYKK